MASGERIFAGASSMQERGLPYTGDAEGALRAK